MSAWYNAVNQAKNSACIIIQSAARRMIVRRAVFWEFGIGFETSMCMDQSLLEEEETSAEIIQLAFRRWLQGKKSNSRQAVKLQRIYRGWKARRFSAKMKEEKSAIKALEIHDAAIQIQRIARGVLVKTRRRTDSMEVYDEKIHSAYTKLLERVEKSSQDIVDQILNGHGSTAIAGPCFRRLADRVGNVYNDTSDISPLPDYAHAILQGTGIFQDLLTKSPLRAKYAVKTDFSDSPRAFVASRKASTPIRCNRTQGQQAETLDVSFFEKGNTEKGSPFGDKSTSMPSPIKKREDWDWADEW